MDEGGHWEGKRPGAGRAAKSPSSFSLAGSLETDQVIVTYPLSPARLAADSDGDAIMTKDLYGMVKE